MATSTILDGFPLTFRLVEDCDVIGQGLEAYHGHRVASVGRYGKILNRVRRDFCRQLLLNIFRF